MDYWYFFAVASICLVVGIFYWRSYGEPAFLINPVAIAVVLVTAGFMLLFEAAEGKTLAVMLSEVALGIFIAGYFNWQDRNYRFQAFYFFALGLVLVAISILVFPLKTLS